MATLRELADLLPNGFHDAQVSSCAIDFVVAAMATIPTGAFSARFWVGSWNSFIHIAGAQAEVTWAHSAAASTRFFLNVDLDIESTEDMGPLAAALEPYAYELERPPGRASFELNQSVWGNMPEHLILEFVRAVKALPPAARGIWDRAQNRTFDIGIQSGRHPFHETYPLRPGALRAAAEIGAAIAVTVYALAPEDDAV